MSPDKSLVLLGGAHVHLSDHLTHIEKRGWRVSQVFDREPAREEALCARLDADRVQLSDLAALNVQGVIICSETAFHEEDITAALTVGLPVFVEKPIAGSAEAARRCASLATEKEVILATGYFLRRSEALNHLRDRINDGALGKVIEARGRFSHDGGYADWLDLDCWMTDPELACYGGFVDEAVHVIDLLQWLVGPINSGQAITGNALGWPVDDHGAAVIDFAAQPATGVVDAGWTDSEMRLELDMVCEAGWARLRSGVLELGLRGQEQPVETTQLPPLDAGEGVEPFLDALEGKDARGLVPPQEAGRVNILLDQMKLRRG
tara:strand:- start:37188 stop:38150 length:963 start_codon:yes stop_codon:yes gene_type:complete